MTDTQLTLVVLPDTLAVCRLPHDAPLPDWALSAAFFSVTRTPDEWSVVCRQSLVPEAVLCESGWRGLKVAGTLAFALTGILAALALPLAEAEISIFALSTFDTDYLLVKAEKLQDAIAALLAAGHHVQL
ncbi:MAG: ACT domain-containing protein [Acidobacteria bacterium]|nr:ACT domain-containing protein [Acidobacteriota bacterium]